MAFKRIALAPLGLMEAPTGDKLIFANAEKEEISFNYQPEEFTYFRCRAITADVANSNGDMFEEKEILKSYKSFIGVGLYKDHDSDSVEKSIGKVLWAEYIPDGKYVECYCAVDKKLAPDLAHRVKNGIINSVSMGASVTEAICPICDNTAHNIAELCPHMTPSSGLKGRRGSDGNMVYEINRGVQFNELSLVTVPADQTARIFEVYAAAKSGDSKKVYSVKEIISDADAKKFLDLAKSKKGIAAEDQVEYDELESSFIARQMAEMYAKASNEALRLDSDYRALVINDGTEALNAAAGKNPTAIKKFQYWLAKSPFSTGLLGPNSVIDNKERIDDAKYSDLAVRKPGNVPFPGLIMPADMQISDTEKETGYRSYTKNKSPESRIMAIKQARGPVANFLSIFISACKAADQGDQAAYDLLGKFTQIQDLVRRYYNRIDERLYHVPTESDQELINRWDNDSVAVGRSIEALMASTLPQLNNLPDSVRTNLAVMDLLKHPAPGMGAVVSDLRDGAIVNVVDLLQAGYSRYAQAYKNEPSFKYNMSFDYEGNTSEKPPKPGKSVMQQTLAESKLDAVLDAKIRSIDHTPTEKGMMRNMEAWLDIDEERYKKAMKEQGIALDDSYVRPGVSKELFNNMVEDLNLNPEAVKAYHNTFKNSLISPELLKVKPLFIDTFRHLSEAIRLPDQEARALEVQKSVADMNEKRDVQFDDIAPDANKEKVNWGTDFNKRLKEVREFYSVKDGGLEKYRISLRDEMFSGNEGLKSEFVNRVNDLYAVMLDTKKLMDKRKITDKDLLKGFPDTMQKEKRPLPSKKYNVKEDVLINPTEHKKNDVKKLHSMERMKDFKENVASHGAGGILNIGQLDSLEGDLATDLYKGLGDRWYEVQSLSFQAAKAYSEALESIKNKKIIDLVGLGKLWKNISDDINKIDGSGGSNDKPTAGFSHLKSMAIDNIAKLPASLEAEVKAVSIEDEAKKSHETSFLPATEKTEESSLADDILPGKHVLNPRPVGKVEIKDRKKASVTNEVARMYKYSEDNLMGLTVSYEKSKTLKSSYFVAREGLDIYRVAAADVMPIVVQESIMANDPEVASPEMIAEDLRQKYSSLSDFKKWAKRRKHKNRKAIKKMIAKSPLFTASDADKSGKQESEEVSEKSTGGHEMSTKANLSKVASEETVTPAAETVITVETETSAPVAEINGTDEVKEIKAAFDMLLKHVQAKLTAKAVKIESVKPVVDCVAKSSVAPMPKGINEVAKTENPKGHVSAALKVEAMDENWSVSEKELDKLPKAGKPAVGVPVHMSVDSAELKSEQMKEPSGGNSSASAVKKYYNQLGGKNTEAPVSMDLKSSQDSEVVMLRKALAEANLEKQALQDKEKLQIVADKIYNVVASLRQKNLLPKGKEEAIVDTLTQKFANIEALDGLKTIIATIENAAPVTEEHTQEELPKIVPQTIESVDPAMDAAKLMSEVWNS